MGRSPGVREAATVGRTPRGPAWALELAIPYTRTDSYDPAFGDSRLGNCISRVLSGTDELRQVRGVKPLLVRPADDVRAEGPVAAG